MRLTREPALAAPVDLAQPFVDAVLPDGSPRHVVIPDAIRQHWLVNIGKFLLSADSLD